MQGEKLTGALSFFDVFFNSTQVYILGNLNPHGLLHYATIIKLCIGLHQ